MIQQPGLLTKTNLATATAERPTCQQQRPCRAPVMSPPLRDTKQPVSCKSITPSVPQIPTIHPDWDCHEFQGWFNISHQNHSLSTHVV